MTEERNGMNGPTPSGDHDQPRKVVKVSHEEVQWAIESLTADIRERPDDADAPSAPVAAEPLLRTVDS